MGVLLGQLWPKSRHRLLIFIVVNGCSLIFSLKIGVVHAFASRLQFQRNCVNFVFDIFLHTAFFISNLAWYLAWTFFLAAFFWIHVCLWRSGPSAPFPLFDDVCGRYQKTSSRRNVEKWGTDCVFAFQEFVCWKCLQNPFLVFVVFVVFFFVFFFVVSPVFAQTGNPNVRRAALACVCAYTESAKWGGARPSVWWAAASNGPPSRHRWLRRHYKTRRDADGDTVKKNTMRQQTEWFSITYNHTYVQVIHVSTQ